MIWALPGTDARAADTKQVTRDQVLPWAVAAVLAVIYAAVGVRRHQQLRSTGYDLGIFEQAVRSYARGHLPVVPLKGPGYDLLGDHFSPVWVVLGPFYRLWPSPLTLVVAQALLFAVAVVPLVGWAQRERGRRVALVIGVGFGLSWGVSAAVGFDVHEVAFAVPLLSFSLCALGQGRPRAAVAWAAPLVLVKEDLGLTLAVVGVLVALAGARRLGLLTALGGLGATAVTVLWVLPAFSSGGTYVYTGSVTGGDGPWATLTEGGLMKLATVLLLLAPTGFLALRSPLVAVVLPTLGWRFLSDNHAYWGPTDHYSAVLIPVVWAAAVHTLARRPTGQTLVRRPTGVRRALALGTVVTLLVLPFTPLADLVRPSTWQDSPRVAVAHTVLDRIPDGATVSASNRLVPQLTGRTETTVFAFRPLAETRPEWIVVDTATPMGWPVDGAGEQRAVREALATGYHQVLDRDGYQLLERD